MHLTANFIGCGRVGKVLAHLFHMHQLVTIGSVLTTSMENSLEAVRFIGAGTPIASTQNVQEADIYFIATPDDKISDLCTSLAKEKKFKPAAIVVHCSGALSSEYLASAKQQGCSVASIHPLKSFADPLASVKSFSDTYCFIEGDTIAVEKLTELFKCLNAQVFKIAAAQKILYHAACVMANNYAVTLHYQSVECYKAAGLDGELAKRMTSNFMNQALQNCQQLPPQQALTGPLQRGDVSIIEKHLAALKPEQRDGLYAALGLATLPLTRHSEELKQAFENIFRASI